MFDKVAELGSARRALLWFHEHGLELPARRDSGDLVWHKPTYHTIHRIVTNPIYGGAYAYGKTMVTIPYDGAEGRRRTRVRARDEWLALRPGAHEGYVDWERGGGDPSNGQRQHPHEFGTMAPPSTVMHCWRA